MKKGQYTELIHESPGNDITKGVIRSAVIVKTQADDGGQITRLYISYNELMDLLEQGIPVYAAVTLEGGGNKILMNMQVYAAAHVPGGENGDYTAYICDPFSGAVEIYSDDPDAYFGTGGIS